MTARFLVADVFDGLATLDDGTVDLVVTSPPFLALRSYLPADHPDKGKEIGSESTPAEFLDVLLRVTAELRRVLAPHGSIAIELGDTYAGSGGAGGDYLPGGWRDSQERFAGSADRATFAEGKASGLKRSDHGRVDRPASGTDSSSGTPGGAPSGTGSKELGGSTPQQTPKFGGARPRSDGTTKGQYDGFKGGGPGGAGWPLAKSKTLIPELYRIALAYGINPLTGQASPAGRWRIRNVVTWCRPNPPVGALGDKWRPATSDVVVACVSDKRYWDDIATRRETDRFDRGGVRRGSINGGDTTRAALGETAQLSGSNPAGAPLLDYWKVDDEWNTTQKYGPTASMTDGDGKAIAPADGKPDGSFSASTPDGPASVTSDGSANNSVLDYWEIPPGGYKGSHYAVFPPALVEPLIKAMAPPKICRTCGEPSRRIVAPSPEYQQLTEGGAGEEWRHGRSGDASTGYVKKDGGITSTFDTVGWSDCGHRCNACGGGGTVTHPGASEREWLEGLREEPCHSCNGTGGTYRPALILDPFAGTGTVLSVATGHGHDAIGIDLDSRNRDLAYDRIGPLMWEEVS